MVAWFVSNCITTSGREKYVSELKKYVDVDVYGACGTLTCSNHIECCKYIIDSIPAKIIMFRTSVSFLIDHISDKMLEREYKFYLAFENSICKDYVTGDSK